MHSVTMIILYTSIVLKSISRESNRYLYIVEVCSISIAKNEIPKTNGAKNMKRKIQEAEPQTLGAFVISKVRELEPLNPVLGTLTDGVWQESINGECWDTIRTGSLFEEPKFITIDQIVKEHNFYIENFERRMNAVLGVF